MCVSVPRRWLCTLGASFALCAATTHASAQAGSQDTPAVRAENLYKKGHALLEAGRYADACPAFEQSERLDPLLGTLLNLAYCHEHEGRTGSAWAEFTRAATQAARVHDPREAFARDSALKLEPRVAWVELAIAPGHPVTDVTVDGEPIAPQLPPRFATDPGSHTIALFIGGQRWQSPVLVARERATVNLTVDAPAEHAIPAAPPPLPAAEPAAPAVPAASSPGPAAPAPPEPERAPAGGRRTAGWILGAVGVAGLGVGAVFGVETLVDKGRANQNGCTGGTGCVPGTQGHGIGEQAWTYSAISTVGFAVGLAGVAAGTWLLVTSRASAGATTSAALHVVPTAGPGGNGLVLAGTW